MTISTIIPVYKNKDLFIKNLKNNYPFLKDTEIIIVDDASHEKMESEINKISKNIKLLINKKNLGFAKSVNKAVSQATGDLILLLNSDVQLIDDSYQNAIQYFQSNKNLFACSFMQVEQNEKLTGKNAIFFRKGLIFHAGADNLLFGKTAWAEGGSAIFRKKFLDDLGGFDELYAPFYWEDIDLCYRAYKRGKQIFFDPKIKVGHHHASTINKYFSRNEIAQIAHRNGIIFIWKNIHDRRLLFKHGLLLIPNICYYILRGEKNFFFGFIKAVRMLPQIWLRRRHEKMQRIKTDKEILSLFSKK